MENRIPKVIHYCWFGRNPKPELVQKCMKSWKENCPDYDFVEWNEDTFDILSNQYVAEAKKKKKWAFVSDYVRLYAIHKYGGIYLDTDVELFQTLDPFLDHEFFTGFESKDSPVTAIIGCEKNNRFVGNLLEYYADRHFVVDGKLDTMTNTAIITEYMIDIGVQLNGKKQTVSGCTIYPEVVFCPNNIMKVFNRYSRKTYCTHHFMGSWGSNPVTGDRPFFSRLRMYLVHVGRNLLGTDVMQSIGTRIHNNNT